MMLGVDLVIGLNFAASFSYWFSKSDKMLMSV